MRMSTQTIGPFSLILIALFLLECPELRAKEYLYVDKDQVSQLRKTIQIKGLHHAEAFQTIKWRVDQQDLSIYEEEVNRYNRSYYAQEAAFLSLVSPRRSERKHYAQLAYNGIRDIYESPVQERSSTYGIWAFPGYDATGPGIALHLEPIILDKKATALCGREDDRSLGFLAHL